VRRVLGVNTWVWTSPLDDESLARLAATAAGMGFRAVELPVETVGGWHASAARDVVAEHGLTPYIVGAMGPGRDLVRASDAAIAETQGYLRECVDVAVTVGAAVVAGPFYLQTGRTWRMTEHERAETVRQLRASLDPVARYAADAGVTLAIEPLNRYETSLLNTVEQALDALEPLLGRGVGLAIDTYHLNIEEKRPFDAVRVAGRAIAHVQVCGNDRGAVGDDHIDWSGFLDALDDAGYTGPLNLESFTSHNDTIATAASIGRPLAESQDALAQRTFDFLDRLQNTRETATS
jgi:D-psicose/D-tagatose/L-ribulose 3-epimerase